MNLRSSKTPPPPSGKLGILGFTPTRTTFLGPFGGGGGFPFQDDFLSSDERILQVNLRTGNFVDAVQVVYENASGVRRAMPVHGAGDKSDREQTFTAHVVLDADEFITGILGRSGAFLDSVFFTTNLGRYGPFGGNGGKPLEIRIPDDQRVIGFFGRAGNFVGALGILVSPRGF